MHVQEFQCLQQLPDAEDTSEPQPLEEGLGAGFGPGQGGRVTERCGAPSFRAARLHDHYGHTALPRHCRQRLKARDRVEPLHVQAKGADPSVAKHGSRQVRDTQLGLIAGGNHIGEWQAPLLHGQANGDVGRLRYDGDTAFVRVEAPPAMLVRPQGRTVEIVEHSVTVRPDDGHFACRHHQCALQVGAVRAFLKSGRVADCAACTQARQFGDGFDGGMAVDADEGGIGRTGEGGYRAERIPPCDVRPRGVDGPDFAVVAHAFALPDNLGRAAAADDGDAPRP